MDGSCDLSSIVHHLQVTFLLTKKSESHALGWAQHVRGIADMCIPFLGRFWDYKEENSLLGWSAKFKCSGLGDQGKRAE